MTFLVATTFGFKHNKVTIPVLFVELTNKQAFALGREGGFLKSNVF